MPHISHKKIPQKTLDELEDTLVSLLTSTGSQTRKKVLKEVLTETERLMIAKRLGIISLLQRGMSTFKISTVLLVSPSTVQRFERTVDAGHYAKTLQWLKTEAGNKYIVKLLTDLVSIPFEAQHKSFYQFVKENY
jgi:uncharacterized protein YerC